MVPLDEDLICTFLEAGMSVKRISDYFNCTPMTIYRRMGNLVNQKMAMFDYEILAKQKELADAGDAKMLIHLGKTRLKQNELPEPLDGDEGSAPTWNVQVLRDVTPTALTEDERAELDEDTPE
jgi:hypothetical protein